MWIRIAFLTVILFWVADIEAEPLTLTDEQQIQLAIVIQHLHDEINKANRQLAEALRERNEYYAKSKKQCI